MEFFDIIKNDTIYNKTSQIVSCNDVYGLRQANILERLIKVTKISGTLFQILFFIFIFMYKSLRVRPMIFLINLSVINFLNLIYGLFGFDRSIFCQINSMLFCKFQALFGHYCICLYSLGVVLLGSYRLACAFNLKPNLVTNKEYIVILLLSWSLPLANVIVVAFSDTPIYFNVLTSNCRLSFVDKQVYFWIFISLTSIIPGILIGVLYPYLIYRIKRKKNRFKSTSSNIHCISSNSTAIGCMNKKNKKRSIYQTNEFKLVFHLIIIYVLYEVYVVTTVLTLTDVDGHNQKIFSDNVITMLRLVKWLPHLLNPMLYLMFRHFMIKKPKRIGF